MVSIIISLEKKPAMNGIPQSAAFDNRRHEVVIGACEVRFPIHRSS